MTKLNKKQPAIQVLQALTDKGDGKFNEDTWGQAGNALWVIDGASGCGPNYYKDGSDAYLFTTILNQVLKTYFCTNDVSPTQGILEKVITKTRNQFLNLIDQKSIPHWHQPSAAFALVRAYKTELEVTLLGDCKVRIEQDGIALNTLCDQRIEPFEHRTLDQVENIQQQHPHATNAERRNLLMPILQKNRSSMNTENGYWVLSFEPQAASQALVYKVNLCKKLTLVSLSSDGFDRFSDLFGKDLPQLSSLKNNPKTTRPLFYKLREIEQADAQCTQYIRAKTHDDATFILAAAR